MESMRERAREIVQERSNPESDETPEELTARAFALLEELAAGSDDPASTEAQKTAAWEQGSREWWAAAEPVPSRMILARAKAKLAQEAAAEAVALLDGVGR